MNPLDSVGIVLAVLMGLCLLGWTISFVEKCIPVFTGMVMVVHASFLRVSNFIRPVMVAPVPVTVPDYVAPQVDSELITPAQKVEDILLSRDVGIEVAAEILTIKVGKKALVILRYYKSSKTVARHISVIDQKLVSTCGRRKVLSVMKVSESWESEKAAIVRQSREDAKVVLGLKTDEPEAAEVQTPVIAPVEAKPQEIKAFVKTEPQTPAEEKLSEGAALSPQQCDDQARKSAKAISKGVLHWHGKAERSSSTGDYKQYRIDYIDDDSKMVEAIWGQDLKRAITSCGAKRGDRIEIFRMGRRKMENDNDEKEAKYMVRFHIVKLSK